MNFNKKVYILFSLQTTIGYTLLLMSLIFLVNSDTYIFEQNVYSGSNDSVLLLVPFMLIYFLFLGILPRLKFFRIDPEICSPFDNYFSKQLGIFVSFFLLSLLYLNILVSGDIPLFSGGYISRFDFLENTKLWFILKFFGQPVFLVPITLGFSFAAKNSDTLSRRLCLYLFFFYLIYLILIGQKFGGPTQGSFLFFFPSLVNKIMDGREILNKKIIVILIALFCSVFVLVGYHYSKYSLANEMGGPLSFILYRIFGLQGHCFWGVIEFFSSIKIHWSNIWDGMNNLMVFLGPKGIYDAIERGVRFTGGYPTSLLISFPYPFSLLIHSIITVIYFILLSRILKNLNSVTYIPLMYIFVYFNIFLSMGSLKMIINSKVFILFIIYIILEIFRKINFNRNRPESVSLK